MFHTVNRIVLLLQIIVIAVVTYVFTIYILPPPTDPVLLKEACNISDTSERYRSILLGSCNNGDLDCNIDTLDDLQNSQDNISTFINDYCKTK